MRIALLKPDFGATGGFERLFDHLRAGLAATGMDVEVVGFDAVSRAERCFGIRVPEGVRHQHHEYFQYLEAVERLDALDLDAYDVVVSSQPPSYLAPHDRVVAVFYHHARRFYDLSDLAVESGIVHADVHAAAVAEVRRLDRTRLGGVRSWLAGSTEVALRLREYWDIERAVRPFRAAPEPTTVEPPPYDPTGPAVCVSRHAWTKRTELLVQAAHVDPSTTYELVGGGDRLPWVRHLDSELARRPDLAGDEDATSTWKNAGPALLRSGSKPGPGASNIRFHGIVDDRARDEAYGHAAVVVAPAYREDYGLTVLEAFDRGRPVIVCEDGGGLVELVEGSGAGMVVEPTGAAIAAAVRALRDDPERAAAMAAAAADTARPQPGEALETLAAAIEDAATRS